MKPSKNSIRIISGEHRSRVLDVVDREGLRPTSNRMRETLFNWIQPLLIGGHCLDLFAGSGALGIESLSRGAHTVTFIEKDREAFLVLRKNIESIYKDVTRYQLHNSDALAYLAKTNESFTAIFLDPPFGHPELLTKATATINDREAFQSVKFIVIEHAIHDSIPQLTGFQLHREMKTKESKLSVWIKEI